MKIPDAADPADYAKLIGNAALGAGLGLAVREMLLVALGGFSAYLYGLIAGPIGWLIVAIAAVWQVLYGGKKLKERCRSELRAKLPTELRRTLDQIVRDAQPKFADLKIKLVESLRDMAEEPARQIERTLDEISEKSDKLKDLTSKRILLLPDLSRFMDLNVYRKCVGKLQGLENFHSILISDARGAIVTIHGPW